ncbi:isoaspartyl peptidase/L-asparaginase family protein [Neptunitalea lumnitzerae]|uniref:Isoaspartyl peptidase/L-asparaginase n=1 Tax=Neptunitalea lumnitzerae TaxID=2965509 RepID=A0ABQ5MFW3_9FLAO|nr:isoaspartyl peptidase/L-asparaginase [Neptunitalea sp. Y10]GLB48298.1 isoaspartyl peptidase/L-asparaginase [Neptunitalea sp. Y10]
MRVFLALLLLPLFWACTSTPSTEGAKNTPKKDSIPTFAIVIHGGAGTILKENMPDSLEAAYKAKLKEAVTKGYAILKNGGSSLDAVEQTIKVMEDSPLFNSAKGAVFTAEGKNELDASFMEGKNLNAGAVAGVTTVKNPISLARAVMEQSEHVMLSGKGAEEFAASVGLEIIDPSYFYTKKRMQSLLKVQEREKQNKVSGVNTYDPYIQNTKYGTVGCVALDQNGTIAAGTSTGGMTNKRWNRIGDSPIIGAGTYANNATCGISSTGWGEYFIRGVVAHDISAMMEYKGVGIEEASKTVIQDKLTKMGGTGGVIGIDHLGTIITEFNTAGMFRASIDANGNLTIGIYKN